MFYLYDFSLYLYQKSIYRYVDNNRHLSPPSSPIILPPPTLQDTKVHEIYKNQKSRPHLKGLLHLIYTPLNAARYTSASSVTSGSFGLAVVH